jgi:two-component system nitrogen regulation sensor histidine kinase NtrY
MQKQVFPKIQFFVKFSNQQIIWNCDSYQISQVLFNLLQNASNAIMESRSEVNGKVLVSLERVNDGLLIVVEDNGPGFPTEKREKLFEPYHTTRDKGTGLGLAIVLRIITEHSGSMELKDAVEHHGARVEIFLPEKIPPTSLS